MITNKSQTHVNTMAEKCVLLHISKIIRRVCSSSHRPTVSIKADLTFISEAAANLQEEQEGLGGRSDGQGSREPDIDLWGR